MVVGKNGLAVLTSQGILAVKGKSSAETPVSSLKREIQFRVGVRVSRVGRVQLLSWICCGS